ncbi:MAG: hypothetical protein JWO47_70 [Candidatus Saccharibacteria bacterium]|nr:hypothetical protein [Candidatus Saccharibacteria bacterium]
MDNNNGQNSWQPNPPEPSPAPESYTPYAHQIPEHGSPDPAPAAPMQPPAPAYQPPAPQPIYIPEQPKPAASWNSEPATASPSLSMPMDDRPVPVVRVLSVRGIEYAMMSIMLWIWSASLIGILVTLINGGASFSVLSFPVSLLIVAVPVFAFFYIRLRRAELSDPSLRLEASKRRFSQITQILAFLVCFSNIVALIAVIMEKIGGGSSVSIPKFIGSTAAVLLVAGGILAYYWIDEHKLVRR